MKKQLLSLSGILGLVLAVGSAHAQAGSQVYASNDQQLSAGECGNAASPGDVIAVGPPALTRQAADCALDFIGFTAAAVKGVKGMDVGSAMRQNWRTYLASQYPMMAPSDRQWFASAPDTMAAVRSNWPRLHLLQKAAVRQQWANAMPGMLQFVAPVVQVSFPGKSRQSMEWQLGEMMQQLQASAMIRQQQNAAAASDLQAQQQLYNMHARSITQQTGMQVMANDTITLMHSINAH